MKDYSAEWLNFGQNMNKNNRTTTMYAAYSPLFITKLYDNHFYLHLNWHKVSFRVTPSKFNGFLFKLRKRKCDNSSCFQGLTRWWWTTEIWHPSWGFPALVWVIKNNFIPVLSVGIVCCYWRSVISWFLGKKARTFDLDAIFEQTRRTAIERSHHVLGTSSAPACQWCFIIFWMKLC